MSQERWAGVDQFLNDQFAPPDAALEAALKAAEAAGLPQIQVTPNQGKLLAVLAQTVGARRILELGTLGGYSTIWLARTLPDDGRLISLEFDPRHAEVARGSIARAGLSGKVEVRVGPALESLPRLESEGAGPFDLVFIDADKVNYPASLDWTLRLTRPGSLIIADNVIRDGAVANPNSTDANVQGVREFITRLAAEPRVTASAVQTVGSKGYDGFAIAVVR